MTVGMDLEALRAELVVTATVHMGKREVPLSGLPLDAIVDICRRHWSDVGGLFDKLVGQVASGDIDPELNTMNWLGGALLAALPQVAAEIITVCAGWSLEAAEVVRALPAPVQLEALDKIAALTFTSEMPPKKVMETVIRMLGGVTKTLIGSAA
jgi:hypothetical protein